MSDNMSDSRPTERQTCRQTVCLTHFLLFFLTTPDAPKVQFIEPVHACHVPFNDDIDGIDTEHCGQRRNKYQEQSSRHEIQL